MLENSAAIADFALFVAQQMNNQFATKLGGGVGCTAESTLTHKSILQ
ncbi:MAG: hypothetical protein NTX03_14665 [Bacteroidetes bacterium]|nr:hypothetical protein [Bacteroidota bacterium]